jgi:hypothetical protein
MNLTPDCRHKPVSTGNLTAKYLKKRRKYEF